MRNIICTVVESMDGKRSISYSKEDLKPSVYVRKSFYAILSLPEIEKIERAKIEELDDILKKL